MFFVLVITLLFSHYVCAENRLPTSVTDDMPYLKFCEEAVKNQTLFREFRHIPVYAGVVETVSFEQGQKYLDIIKKQFPDCLRYMDIFKSSDSVGNPHVYFYTEIGNISPTTLRYIKIASDLRTRFGSLDALSIIEIGGGYGGQCKIIMDMFNCKKYTIIDLPGPLALTKKFLQQHNIHNVELLTPWDSIPDKKYDIVISNYAFSECTLGMQEQYVRDVFSISSKGYCICNCSPCDGPLGHLFLPKKAVLELFNKYQIPWKEYKEQPLTSVHNYLMVWVK